MVTLMSYKYHYANLRVTFEIRIAISQGHKTKKKLCRLIKIWIGKIEAKKNQKCKRN